MIYECRDVSRFYRRDLEYVCGGLVNSGVGAILSGPDHCGHIPEMKY